MYAQTTLSVPELPETCIQQQTSYDHTNSLNLKAHVIILIQTKLEIWGKAQHEPAWRPKSDWRKFQRGEIPPVAKLRGPNSNALAYAECPMST